MARTLPRAAAGTSVPPAAPPSPKSVRRSVREDLRANDPTGLFRGLIEIAKLLSDLACTVEGLAWPLDRARRGVLSAPARQDVNEVSSTIVQLLREPLLDDADRALVEERVRAVLGSRPATPRRRAGR